jgi:hypothetical protein
VGIAIDSVVITIPWDVFHFKNGPNIKTVSNASEYFGGILNIRDNDRALVCFI